jgi:Tfp pilus assembly protein FimV
MKIRHTTFALPLALMLHGLVSLAWAQEPSKQAPLEMPKALIQLDSPVKPAASEEKEKPKAVVKKAKPPVVVAEAAPEPAKDSVKEAAKDSAAVAEIGSYKVKAGDTVERVIQKFYASSPLRIDVLRDALVQNNPKSFVKGNPKSLMAGTTLSLPDQTELLKKLVPTLVAAEGSISAPITPSAMAQANVVTPVNVAPVGGAAAHQAGHNQAMPDPKRNWVRYP